MASQSVTIEDVAKAAHVSRQTVSRVINHATNVSESAREKVEKAIEELGYVPNLAARRMGGSRSYVLMALIERGAAHHLPLGEMLMAGLDECSANGYHIMFEQIAAPSAALQFSEAEAEMGRVLMPIIGAVQPDGVVILPPLDHCAPLLSALKKRGVASACLANRQEFGRTVPGLDEGAFAQTAADRLVALGHRQIGFVPGAGDRQRSQRRIEGYRRRLAEAGSRAQRHFVAEPVSDAASARALAREWLTPTIRPTAIITETAEAALAFAQVARTMKLSVPHDLSILSLEETPSLADATPGISALHLPYGTMFGRACEKLIKKEQSEGEENLQQACVFVERASTGKAPRVV
ncbi:LacI family DNA-binding transcriptional regulator [Erythrobacter sp. SCSIO 43205]|uniref:LacI family DNA-binding transcriptional regulator n=1 Tax=Erythrobacter sp. SCSIO 43205 TaxID=2779361 RepID=UPI001CA98EE9|nr:LacI family DNA-binding transcriptional regulator [Erythrobacter sp. SCSIO 43205]UAB78384.1 LacI family DNA-binding transcriptional regulator [Erythrobacter sp. SCSIO 43205]